MNSSMLSELKSYEPHFLPQGVIATGYPIYHRICLTTKHGAFDGHIRKFVSDDSSCIILFETRDSIHYIDVNDIFMFNTLGYKDKQKIGY